MTETVQKSAIISSCCRYRYELRREWDSRLPPYVSGMLNPSTADANLDDRTISRNVGSAQSAGCGSLIVWNLGAGRATDPRNWIAMQDPIGPENDSHIRRILSECRERNGVAVVGWGNRGSFMMRDRAVLEIAKGVGITFNCLGVTKTGQPKHPLYIASCTRLTRWPVENFEIGESLESLESH